MINSLLDKLDNSNDNDDVSSNSNDDSDSNSDINSDSNSCENRKNIFCCTNKDILNPEQLLILEFLNDIYPALDQWVLWFLHSQKGTKGIKEVNEVREKNILLEKECSHLEGLKGI